ncbi:MAG: hypothetical protein DDG58_05870 [Ardenticatenia bacterium]|nr:MAG: hypothetical protein DDG58_05870 [Ardenticatenia bacterium]
MEKDAVRRLLDRLGDGFRVILPLLLIPLVTGCAPGVCSGTRPIVKIGLAAPFEGVARPLGYEALQGVKLAVAQWNAHGGPGGYMVELAALNDSHDAHEARLQAEEFLADPAVLGVIAGWHTATAEAMVPILSQGGLATVLPWSLPALLTDPDRGIAMLAAHEGQVAQALVEQLPTTIPRCHIAVVGDELAVAPYRESLPACARSVAPPAALHRQALQTWAAALLDQRAPPLEALILVVDPISAGEIAATLQQAGWSGRLFGAADVGSTQLTDVAGQWADGMVVASPAPSGADGPLHVNGDGTALAALSPRGALAYDAAQVLLTAIADNIAQMGYPSRAGVVAALAKVQAEGLTGPIAFDLDGRRLHAAVWFYRIEDHRYPGVLVGQVER